MMKYDQMISDLQRDAETRDEAVRALTGIRDEIGRVIDLLSGSASKKKRSSTGQTVTADDVRQAVNAVRAESPDLSDELVARRATERLKKSGKRLNGISLRLKQVLGESTIDG